MEKQIKIALAGNPNSGKTTLFNALTGSSQHVGNWPGVTVEKKEGRLRGHADVTVQDLPGVYSLSPYTLEEVVARDYLVGEKPDAILNIVDASNLERNLYLTTQLLELGVPVVVALNMMDVVRKQGGVIDVAGLSRALAVRWSKFRRCAGSTASKRLRRPSARHRGARPQSRSGLTTRSRAHSGRSKGWFRPAARLRRRAGTRSSILSATAARSSTA